MPNPIIVERTGGVAIELIKALAVGELGNQLGNNRERILFEMKANPKISGAQLAELLNISKTAIEKNIKQMGDAGQIKRVGGTRGIEKS